MRLKLVRTDKQVSELTGLSAIRDCCALTWDRVFLEDGNSYIYIDRRKSKKQNVIFL